MTIADIKELVKGEYVAVEVYVTADEYGRYPAMFETSTCREYEGEVTDDMEIVMWQLMDEYDYQLSILCSSTLDADFEEWYGDPDARVLCVMLK